MDEMRDKNYMWLNKLILDVAIKGDCDCHGCLDVYWKTAGEYGIVLVVTYDKWWYRIFEHLEEYQFNPDQVLQSLDNSDDSQYIYGCYENITEREWELQKCSSMDWVEPLKAVAAEEHELP